MKYFLLALFLFSFSTYGKANLCSKEKSAEAQAQAKWEQAYAKSKQAQAKYLQADAKWDQAYVNYKQALTKLEQADANRKQAFTKLKQAQANRNQANANWDQAIDIYMACRDQADASFLFRSKPMPTGSKPLPN